MNTRISTALAAAAIAALGLPAAACAAVPGETQLRGTITAIVGKYDVHVQDRHGDVADVTLHQGTIINPTGLTLRPGMRVTILGNPTGGTFNADEIDTPYHIDVAPVATYWGPGAFYGPGPYWGGNPFWGARWF